MYESNLSYNLEVSGLGYYSNSTYINLNTFTETYNVTVNMYPVGTQQIFIKNVNGSSITASTNVTFSNSTTQLSFIVTGGTANITGLSPGSTYTVILATAGFAQQIYTYTYPVTTPTAQTYYLSPSAVPITFTVQDTTLSSANLAGVLVTVKQFVGGVYTVVGSKITDATGVAVINAVQGVLTQTTFELTNYATLQLDNTLPLDTYTVIMSPVNRFDSFNSISSFINYQFQPTANDLHYNQTMLFNLTVTQTDSIALLDYFNISLYNQAGALINTTSSTSQNGGSINLSLNLIPYNGTTITARYSFKKANFGVYTAVVVYNVADVAYTGTPAELRAWLLANVSLGWRIFLWFFCTISFILGFRALGITGSLLGIIGVVLFAFFGWIFTLSTLILTIIVIIGFIIFIAGSIG
jgi:hypothetical protein